MRSQTQLLVVSYLLTTSRVWLAVHFPVICTKMSSFPFYQIGCIIRRVQFKHIRFQVVKLSVWFTSGLQCVYCSFYIIYSGWKADSVAFVVPPCVYIRVYSTVVIKIYAKVLFAITFFSVAGVMHPKKVWVLFIQIYKFTIKCETRKKKGSWF